MIGSPGAANIPAADGQPHTEQPQPPEQINAPPPGWNEDDDMTFEVGVEWINDFPGTVDDRTTLDDDCDGLYYPLTDNDDWGGSSFRWANGDAWEVDFRRSNYGGNENNVVDTIDLAMVCTLGTDAWDQFNIMDLRSLYFGSSMYDHYLTPGDGYHSYGNNDLEWLIFIGASLLNNNSKSYWYETMNGLHLLLGFSNNSYASNPGIGYHMAKFMRGRKLFDNYFVPPKNIEQAWFLARDYSQPGSVCARIIAEDINNFGDYLWGRGDVTTDPVYDYYYFWSDHCATDGNQAANQGREAVTQALSVPLVSVEPRVIDDNYVREIAAGFNISETITSDEDFYYMVHKNGLSHELMVDKITGSFDYRNWNEMWVPPVVTPTLPSLQVALDLVEDFFSQNKGMPGAWYRNGQVLSSTESIVGQAKADSVGEMSAEVISSMPMDLMIEYERQIAVEITTTEGMQAVALPVVGPGSNMKVYIGDGSEIIGMHGGSRDVDVTAAMVEVLPFEDAWELYLADPSIALPEPNIQADEFEVTAHTLGYYEMPYLIRQDELIPVWIVTANVLSGTMPLETGVQINVPAATQYSPPVPIITAPISGTVVGQGEWITLEGIAESGNPPYTLEWSSSEAGFLGAGKTLPVVLPPSGRIETVPQWITLTVTDANGQSGSVSILVFVKPKMFLPVMIR
jgi:hypothetical protein